MMYTPPKKKGPRTNKTQHEGKLRLRVGDLVRVITGKDKGKEGTVSQVLPSEGKVVIEGINITVKHQKARPQPQQNVVSAAASQPQGGRIEKAAPIPASKVQLVDPADSNKLTRIGVKTDAEGNRVRVARKSGSVLENG
jgi:large subunit ribosomal protein L24